MSTDEIEFRAPDKDWTVMPDDLAKAKRLLKSAVKAAETLAEDVAELIRMRAWEVLGYPNFSDMWEAETGFKCPAHIQNLAVFSIADEGMDSRKGAQRVHQEPNGHMQYDVAAMVGLPVKTIQGRYKVSSTVGRILKQREAGVPPENITHNDDLRYIQKRIDQFGDQESVARKRAQPRRMGKSADDLVMVGFNIPKREAEAIAEVARKADVPNAEIYRQAVAEYLARLNGGAA